MSKIKDLDEKFYLVAIEIIDNFGISVVLDNISSIAEQYSDSEYRQGSTTKSKRYKKLSEQIQVLADKYNYPYL